MPILKHFKKVLKYSKNAHTRKEKGQGNKSIGSGSRRAKKQAQGQKMAI